MADFMTLACPTCSGPLVVTKDIDRFACEHCGREHVVRRDGGTIFLQPVMEILTGVKAGVDRQASELAITRLKKEIPELEIARQEKLREKQVAAGQLPTLQATLRMLNTQKRRAFFWLAVSAAIALVAYDVAAISPYGPFTRNSSYQVDMACGISIAALIWTLVRAARVVAFVREVSAASRQLSQYSSEWPKREKQFDEEIAAIGLRIARTEQELAGHQQRVAG
jgi:hypothetical protein